MMDHFVEKQFNVDQSENKVRYIFVDERKYGLVWRNIIIFATLHVVYLAGLFHLIYQKLWSAWIFGYVYSILGGIGITVGAHRLWSHRSYKATLPLRTFLMICQSMAGQNDLLTWCRDHRIHHKYSETDADPHNARRGFFFAHVGWLLTRKHPDIFIKGRNLNISDLLEDPVIRFQRKYYPLLYITFCFLLPTLLCHYVIGHTWLDSLIVGSFGRYIVALHCTWFVNSAAHMWGDRPYKKDSEPRENTWVSLATWGEGFHNFHHVFPYDYAISETGFKLDPMRWFIDLMAEVGHVWGRKRASPYVIHLAREKNL